MPVVTVPSVSAGPPSTAQPTAQPPAHQQHWTPNDSAALYGIDAWGDPYFAVNARGHITVQPRGAQGLHRGQHIGNGKAELGLLAH